MGGEKMLDVQQAAKRIGVDIRHVYVLIQCDQLAAVNVGHPEAKRPTWRIPESSLLAFLQRRTSGAPLGMQTREA